MKLKKKDQKKMQEINTENYLKKIYKERIWNRQLSLYVSRKKQRLKEYQKKYQEAKKSRKKIEFFFTKMKPKTLIFD